MEYLQDILIWNSFLLKTQKVAQKSDKFDDKMIKKSLRFNKDTKNKVKNKPIAFEKLFITLRTKNFLG
jgi:hypothetical protein